MLKKTLPIAAIAIASALFLTGCGTDKAETPTPTETSTVVETPTPADEGVAPATEATVIPVDEDGGAYYNGDYWLCGEGSEGLIVQEGQEPACAFPEGSVEW